MKIGARFYQFILIFSCLTANANNNYVTENNLAFTVNKNSLERGKTQYYIEVFDSRPTREMQELMIALDIPSQSGFRISDIKTNLAERLRRGASESELLNECAAPGTYCLDSLIFSRSAMQIEKPVAYFTSGQHLEYACIKNNIHELNTLTEDKSQHGPYARSYKVKKNVKIPFGLGPVFRMMKISEFLTFNYFIEVVQPEQIQPAQDDRLSLIAQLAKQNYEGKSLGAPKAFLLNHFYGFNQMFQGTVSVSLVYEAAANKSWLVTYNLTSLRSRYEKLLSDSLIAKSIIAELNALQTGMNSCR